MAKWQPKQGEIYYYVTDYGSVNYERFYDDEESEGRLAIGNCFKTEEEVVKTAKGLGSVWFSNRH